MRIFLGPATFTVLLAAGVLLLIGGLILARRGRTRTVCRACGRRNTAGAQFCGNCGARL